MKQAKKLLAFLLVAVLVISLGSLSAFALDDPANNDPAPAVTKGSITINNATVNETYKAYKILDATYSGDAVAYTTKSPALFKGSPFTVAENADANGNYAVWVESGKESEALEWVKENHSKFSTEILPTSGADDTGKATGAVVVFKELDFGYYYITSSLGTTITVDSAVPDATVIDKNQKTTNPDKQEQIADGTWVYEGSFAQYTGDTPTASVGDTVNYRVVGTFTQYQETEAITKLYFVDTMSDGLTANKDVAIKINGQTATGTVAYTQDDNGQWVTTIEIPTATVVTDETTGEKTITFLYNPNNTYEITYSATINDKAIVDGTEENTVELRFNENNEEHKIGEDKTEVKDYNITLTKQDANTKDKLAGAQFKLYAGKDTDGKGKDEVKLVLVPQVVADGATADPKYGTEESAVNNVYRPAKQGETPVDAIVTGKTGVIEIKGLKNGEYYFEETVAPKGYNKLQGLTEATTVTNANATITVDNNKGTELPSTGGIGTTIFYVVGGVLLVGAGVLLVTKKRAGGDN